MLSGFDGYFFKLLISDKTIEVGGGSGPDSFQKFRRFVGLVIRHRDFGKGEAKNVLMVAGQLLLKRNGGDKEVGVVVEGVVKQIKAGGETPTVGIKGSSEHFSKGAGGLGVSKKQGAQVGKEDGGGGNGSGTSSRCGDDGGFAHGVDGRGRI